MRRFSLSLVAPVCFLIGILITASPWMTFGGLVWLLPSIWEQAVPSENAGERGMQEFISGGLSVIFGLTVMAISAVSGMLWAVLENFLSTDGGDQGEPHGDGGQAKQSDVRGQ